MRHAHQPAVLHYDQYVKTRKLHVPSKAPPPPLRGTSPAAAVGGFVGGKPDICAIHRCPSCRKGFEHS